MSGQARLSPRELQVLELVRSGRTNGEIADALQVSVHTVKFHLASIYRKLGVSNRTQAAVAHRGSPAAPMVPLTKGDC
jgi:DNA-binding CsgD family transcriptional regulator